MNACFARFVCPVGPVGPVLVAAASDVPGVLASCSAGRADGRLGTPPRSPVPSATSIITLGGEGLDPGDRPPQNQRMNVMRAFISVDGLKIHSMPNDVVIV